MKKLKSSYTPTTRETLIQIKTSFAHRPDHAENPCPRVAFFVGHAPLARYTLNRIAHDITQALNRRNFAKIS
jgi:hypothetical protein